MPLDDRVLVAKGELYQWLLPFLEALVKNEGDTDAAAEAVGMELQDLYRIRENDAYIRAAWDKTLKAVRVMRAHRLEAVAYHEAAFPPKRYKFTPSGEAVTHPDTGEAYYEEDRDNRLVVALLKALDRETYGDRQMLTGPDGGAVRVEHQAKTLADIVRISALLDKGDIAPETVVGEILEAEVVDEKV